MPQTHKMTLIRLLYIALGAIGLILSFRYLLPLLSPFILAYLTAALMEPAVHRFETRVRLPRWILSGIVTVILFGLVFCVCKGLVLRAAEGMEDLLRSLAGAAGTVSRWVREIGARLDGYVKNAPTGVGGWLSSAYDSVADSLSRLPGEISASAVRNLASFAARMPEILFFLGTYVVGTFFISSRFNEVRLFLARQIPDRFRKRAGEIKTGMAGTLVKWLKAQLMLMCVTFFELTAGFLLLRFPHALLTAAVTALIDALPVFGVGTVLLPWAAYQLLTGNPGSAAGLSALYLVITVIRSLLEPKLVGAQTGVSPVATLVAIYLGFRLTGAAGMILFPLGLIVIKQLNDEGIVKLWR